MKRLETDLSSRKIADDTKKIKDLNNKIDEKERN